jgi:UTP--glucose-1-phosphate uridylyltransferase
MTHPSELKHLPAFIEKMESEHLPRLVIDTFVNYYKQVSKGATGLISDRELNPVSEEEIADARKQGAYNIAGEKAYPQAVMIVLNGGLGTSMGLTGAKSLLAVKDEKSFLQLKIEQAEAKGIGLIFMNSFNTDEDTRAAVAAIRPSQPPRYFLQHKFPKILRENLAPAQWPPNPELEWNPPGHGEIYTALHTSGLLDKLLADGVMYALIANSDNLGATMDPALLGYFCEKKFPIMMEVAQRTPADMKGGHLARHAKGRLILREIAQCPEDERKSFQDIAYYRFFNTNSLWINLKALRRLISTSEAIYLPIILNPKTLDPRDKSSPAVYQIETARGSAVSLFDGAAAVNVPQERFCPVKKCSDLLAVRSDCFILSDDSSLISNPKRRLGRIKINLDPDYYGSIEQFDARFPQGPPSLIDCDSLTVQGDVVFEKEVTIKNTVRICNTRSQPVTISSGSVIDKDLEF